MKYLWQDTHTGKLSTSKIWSHIAYAAATWIVINKVDAADWEMLLVYMAVVGGSEIAKKILTLKFTALADKSKD